MKVAHPTPGEFTRDLKFAREEYDTTWLGDSPVKLFELGSKLTEQNVKAFARAMYYAAKGGDEASVRGISHILARFPYTSSSAVDFAVNACRRADVTYGYIALKALNGKGPACNQLETLHKIHGALNRMLYEPDVSSIAITTIEEILGRSPVAMEPSVLRFFDATEYRDGKLTTAGRAYQKIKALRSGIFVEDGRSLFDLDRGNAPPIKSLNGVSF